MAWQRKSLWYLECDQTGMRISKMMIQQQAGYTLWSNEKPRKILKTSRKPETLKRYAAKHHGTETDSQQ